MLHGCLKAHMHHPDPNPMQASVCSSPFLSCLPVFKFLLCFGDAFCICNCDLQVRRDTSNGEHKHNCFKQTMAVPTAGCHLHDKRKNIQLLPTCFVCRLRKLKTHRLPVFPLKVVPIPVVLLHLLFHTRVSVHNFLEIFLVVVGDLHLFV